MVFKRHTTCHKDSREKREVWSKTLQNEIKDFL